MIETVAQLSALMITVQSWMLTFNTGRSWAFPVKYTITDTQLYANKPNCCRFLTNEGGIIMRVNNNVYLIKN